MVRPSAQQWRRALQGGSGISRPGNTLGAPRQGGAQFSYGAYPGNTQPPQRNKYDFSNYGWFQNRKDFANKYGMMDRLNNWQQRRGQPAGSSTGLPAVGLARG